MESEKVLIKDCLKFLKKSKIKAGEGLSEGKYPFYTSSSQLNKYLNYYEIEEESLIFGTGGNASIHHSYGKFSTSTDCFVLQSNDKFNINLKYVYLFLKGNIHILEHGFKGAGLKHISKKYIKNIVIPLPSLQIQKKIVKVLDKVQALIDKRKEQIRLLDDLIQSIFYDMFGNPVTNPKGWELKKIGDIYEVKTGGTPSRKNKKLWENGSIYWLKTNEVVFKIIYNTEEKINPLALEKTNVTLLPVDTLVIAMYGQGKTRGRVAKLGVEATTNQACAALLPVNKMNTDFMFNYLRISYEELRKLGRGGNQPNLNLNLVREFNVIIPPLDLQNQFASIVQKIESQKQLLEKSLKEMENNYNSLMQRAFNGELFG